ncbi:hypothetical protein IJ102_00070 [Candidatus Saccharibacteria bacterium]|nr:hypothetical protein [Candidatus Saccharibacteria bacterium]
MAAGNKLEAHNIDDGKFSRVDDIDNRYKNTFGGDVLAAGETAASEKPQHSQQSADTTAAQNAREQGVAKGVASTLAGAVTGGAAGAAANFISKVSGRDSRQKSKLTGGLVKKAAPFLAVVLGIGGFAGLSVSSQMSLPIALAEQVIRNHDHMSVENQLIGKNFMRMQMNPRTRTVQANGAAHNYLRQHGAIYAAFTGDTTSKYFKMTDYQREKLARHNIELVDLSDGSGQQYMRYTQFDADGNVASVTNVVADPAQTSLVDGAIDFDSAMSSDGNSNFQKAYYEGAKTFRSAVGDWFKAKTTKILSALGVNRNRFSNFDVSDDEATNKQRFLDDLDGAQGDKTMKGTIENETAKTEEYEDDNGNKHKRLTDNDDGRHAIKTETDSDNISTKSGQDGAESAKATVEGSVSKKLDSIGKAANQVTDLACTITEVAGNINAVVTAYQTLMVIRLAAGVLEGIQKTQVADSNTSPVHEIVNAFTDNSQETTITLADTANTEAGSWATIASGNDNNAEIATKEYTSRKSAMESAGIAALFGGTVAGIAANEAFSGFSFNSFLRAGIKRIGSDMSSVKQCAYTQLAQAVLDAGRDLKMIVQCFIPPGLGCLKSALDAAGQIAQGIAWSVVVAVVKTVIVSAITPFVTNILTRSISDTFFGETLGNQFADGAMAYLTKSHHAQGGAYQTKDSYIAYLNMKDDYDKGEALYAQRTKSPFDTSSPYTFMGSLFSKSVVLRSSLANATGAMGVMNTLLNSAGSSLKSIVPGAKAAGNGEIAQSYQEYTEENCPNQAAAGFIVYPGVSTCRVIVSTTPYTINSDPGENIYKASTYDDNFKDTGSETDLPEIKEDGKYAEYLRACTISDVEPGEPDYNLKNEYETATTGNVAADAVLGQVPLVGSAMSLFNSEKVLEKSAYISKEACAYGYSPGQGENIPSSEQLKTYGAIYPQSRVAVGQGLTDTDIVGNYIQKYYEEHPIDTSFEGILAHYSGLTKDMVIATIDQMDALNFLAKYEPAGYGPLFYEEPEVEYQLEDTENYSIDNYALAYVRYAEERRVRNFAI